MSMLESGRSHTAAMVALVLGAVAVVGLGTGFLVGYAGGGQSPPSEPGPATSSRSPAGSSPATTSPARPTTRADSDVERGRRADLGYFLGASHEADGIHVRFDRALLYVGAEAEEYAEDNGLEESLSDGRLLVNQNPRTRDMVLAPDVKVIGGRDLAGRSKPQETPVQTLLDAVATRGPDILLDLTYDDLGYIVVVREKDLR